MKIYFHRCPISWYIGQFFSDSRKTNKISLEDIAKEIQVSVKYLKLFENGKTKLDAIFLMKLEKFYCVNYSDYKPPVHYFGFLGITCREEEVLLLSKQTISSFQKLSKSESSLSIQNKFLKLRYSPLRGKRE